MPLIYVKLYMYQVCETIILTLAWLACNFLFYFADVYFAMFAAF
jgi:hypothetical protein